MTDQDAKTLTSSEFETCRVPAGSSKPVTPIWRDSYRKRLAAAIAFPVFRFLNRPAFKWLTHAIYDFALRSNGIAINFPGSHGLTFGEEQFILRRLKSAPSGVFFDVGANHGAYSRYLLSVSPGSRVYAFEPHPRTFNCLRENLCNEANVRLVNSAVAESAGKFKLYDFENGDGSTQASLDQETIKMFSDQTTSYDVSVITIDEFMAEEGIEKVDLLKIDTEGFDLAVLRGARKALAAHAIGVIQFEFIPANIARHVTMRDFFEVLEEYSVYRICVNGSLLSLEPYDVKRCEIYVTHNLVALPKSAASPA